MPDLLAGFPSFCQSLRVLTKDHGVVPIWPLYDTQQYFLDEVARGLEAGIHTFVVLKGRQQGLTTICDCLDLFWLQTNPGLLGMLVSDDPDNMKFRRVVLRSMLASLPKEKRYPVHVDNLGQLVFTDPKTRDILSMLLFANAGKREDSNSNLGRSKGLSYLHADEVGAWQNDRAVSALEASLSDQHPKRLYHWGSTAQGAGVFQDIWNAAQDAVTQRAIFIGWWRHRLYRIARDTPVWEAYAGPLTSDEKLWTRAVKRRYGFDLEPEQIVWYRYQLAEKFRGDDTMRAQEHPCLPEDAFQAFGEHFIPPEVIRKLRDALPAKKPEGWRYEFGEFLDTSKPVRCALNDATLKIYAEPEQHAVYLVAAHPWGSSSPEARSFEAQVWRVWPDRMALVAEYHAEQGQMYHFAWVCLHLLGAYRSFANSKTWNPTYFMLEIGWAGERVLRELDRVATLGYGLSPVAMEQKNAIADMLACVEYLFRRIDSFSPSLARQNKTSPELRVRMLYALRDEVERGHLTIPSAGLIDELATLRRGEEGDTDQVGGGAAAPESRAITAAMGVTCWLDQILQDAAMLYVAPKEDDAGPTHVGEQVVGSFLNRLKRTGRT